MMTETFGAMLAVGTLIAELAQHRPTQNFITKHHKVLTYIVAPLILLIGGWIGSYPQEHEDWSPWSRHLHRWLIDPSGDGSNHGSIVVPKGSSSQRRTSAFFIICTAVSLFLSPLFQKALSHRLLVWLGHHSFAVYLTHGTILRTVGMWIAYGISGEPWQQAGKNEDGSPQEQIWLKPKSRAHVMCAILVFITLAYIAAWAWMKWVDTACARATQWLEKKVFDEEDSEGKSGLAEKGYSHPNGNGIPPPRAHDADRSQPPP